MARPLEHPIFSSALAEQLGLTYDGLDLAISGAGAVSEAQPGQLCFVKSEAYLWQIPSGAIVLCPAELQAAVRAQGAVAIQCRNARLDFARALGALESMAGFVWSKQDPWVHPTASIGANVVLGQGVRIGARTRVQNNVVIGNEVLIGERCIIKSGAVIGEEGFGFERDEHGHAVRLPHIGSTLIEDDVEVGSLTTVCRGTLGWTVLRQGCKVDDHVHIAHNVIVGEHAFIIADAEVSGGVVIGREAWVSPCATIKNQVRIGDRAVIGLGAVVLKDVDPGAVIVGNPGKPLKK